MLRYFVEPNGVVEVNVAAADEPREVNSYLFRGLLPKPNCTPLQAFASMLYEGRLTNETGYMLLKIGADLLMRKLQTGTIVAAVAAKKTGKVTQSAILAKLAEICGTEEFATKVAGGQEPIAIATEACQTVGITVPDGMDSKEAAVVKASYKALKKRPLQTTNTTPTEVTEMLLAETPTEEEVASVE